MNEKPKGPAELTAAKEREMLIRQIRKDAAEVTRLDREIRRAARECNNRAYWSLRLDLKRAKYELTQKRQRLAFVDECLHFDAARVRSGSTQKVYRIAPATRGLDRIP